MFSKILKWMWDKLSEEKHDRIKKILTNSASFRNLVSILRPNIVKVKGNKMYIDTKRNPAIALYDIGGYENAETELFESHIKEGDVVMDIGANIGYYTLVAAKLVGANGKVYAFEPESINFSFLKKSVEINNYENVICEKKAVSNENGKLKLFLHKFQTGAYTLVGGGDNYVEVETVKLDDYFKDKNSRVDVIKMDIEGAEGLALKGMEKILNENKDIKFFSEIIPKQLEKTGISAKDYLDILTNAGFSIYEIVEEKDKSHLKLIQPSEFSEFIHLITLKPHPLTNIFCKREDKNVT
ncbi:MAG: hypothetical protein COV98_01990 [Candidatus Altarchaeum sp. CG12_big_fil_rev_8_21_14_0_65_33_22]|nr:MAG: hypothetical protein COV98_01990 [Candidatus Altarchaeum sp. CG12_big_fil_rev_8_21_14_0_65_33_22]